MIRVALILDGIVSQIAVWDGVAPWDHPLGMEGVELLEGEWCEPGAVYDENASPRFSTLL
jgi:hypothetical protein